MIQINLIPDIKREYLRAKVVRNTAISISIIVGIAAVGVVALIGVILAGQAIREVSIDGRIKDEHSKLTEIGPLGEALTLQHQLVKVSSLNQDKKVTSRMFQVLQAINPGGEDSVQFTMVRLSPDQNQISIDAVARNGYPAAEALKKTILNTKLSYKDGGEVVESELASSVVDGDASYGVDSSGRRVLRFSMTIEYTSNLFSNTITSANVNGPTGNINVTDSKIGVPKSLFSVPASDIDRKED